MGEIIRNAEVGSQNAELKTPKLIAPADAQDESMVA
jgi:hypothetical protein